MNGSSIGIGTSAPTTGVISSIELYSITDSNSHKELLNLLTGKQVKNVLLHSVKNNFYSDQSRFSIIPSVFFDKENMESMCSSVFSTFESEILIDQYIPEIDSHFVFPFSTTLKNELQSKIGHTEISHQYCSLISAYHLYYLEDKSEMAFIHYQEKHFSLCLFKNKKMVFFNGFDMNSFEDVLYYTYYSIEQYGFNPSSTKIHFGGYSSFSDQVTVAFQKYSSQIFHISPNNIANLDPKKSDKLISTIFDLQCG